jgi:segregation and condensation protein B
MDEERERLEGIVSALELKVSELDEDNVSAEEAAQLRTELDDTYEQIDASDLQDDVVDALMDRLDDLQDILEDLVADPDWDDDEQAEEKEEEDDDETKAEEDNDDDEDE